MELDEFWCKMVQTYPTLAKRAFQVIVPFVTTYLCESGFSLLVTIKTNARNKLNVTLDMRVALSNTSPRIDPLVANRQQQCLH